MEEREIRQRIGRVFNRIGWGLTLLLAGQFLLAIVAAFILARLAPDFAQAMVDSDWMLIVFSYGILYLVALPLAMLVLRTTPDFPLAPPLLRPLTPWQLVQTVCACASVAMLLNLASTGLGNLIELWKGSAVENPLDTMLFGRSPLVIFVLVVLVAPVMEEYIFRWVLYKKLAVFGPKVYFLVSGLAFSLFHMNLYQMLYAFVLGVVFAAITYYTGCLRYSILAHAGVNLAGGGITILVMAYGDEMAMGVWGLCIFGIIAAGIVVAVRWLLMTRGRIYLPPGQAALPAKRIAILNPGMLVYVFFTLAYTVYAALA